MSEADANPRLEAALAYAARGWHVFPAKPGQKVPATINGHNDATTDFDQIRTWWRLNPNYNVAISCGPSNLFVVDVDPQGISHWENLIAEIPGLSDIENNSLCVETPRGGFHIYMEGEGPTSSSKLAIGVDTRGKGGYVLAPPSYVDDGKSKGRYTGAPHLDALQPAFAPIVERLKRNAVEVVAPVTPPEKVDWDLPETINRAEAWLTTLVDNGDVAVEGQAGDQRTYEVACRVLEMGISPDKAYDLLVRLWNPYCEPSWDAAELHAKVHNAWKYGQETKGGKAQPPLEKQFSHLIEQRQEEIEAAEEAGEIDPKLRFTPVLLKEARANLKPLEWVIPNLIPRKGTGIIYGKPGTFKTFLMLDLGMSVATGHGPNWWQEGDREPQPVLFLAGEGPHAFKGQRVDAWLARHMLPGLVDRAQMYVVDAVPPFEMPDYWRYIVDWLKENKVKPAMVVVDTLSKAMLGLDENAARDASKATSRMDWMARELGCFVLAVHHSGKDADRGARGSNALLGNVDVMIEVDRPTKANLEVFIHTRKVKDGIESEVPWKYEGRPYGESMAFAREWDWEPPEPKIPDGDHSEEWAQPEALIDALADGPLTLEHLSATIGHRFDVPPGKVKAKYRTLSKGRYQAFASDEGQYWQMPTGKKKEEF